MPPPCPLRLALGVFHGGVLLFNMLCTLSFFHGDKDQAIRLAEWIRELGNVKHHDCLLVVDPGTNETGVIEPFREAFGNVWKINSEPFEAPEKWGSGTTDARGPNELFLAAAIYVETKLKRPFFWMEPDAVPMRASWLDEIEQAYRAAKKPFMGMYVNIPPHEPHMSGIGVYPAMVADYSMAMRIPGKIAWDYAGRVDTVGSGPSRPPKAHFTNLIQHEYRVQWYGEEKPVGPSFPTKASLKHIKPETVVFHRCKDETLIDRLREQRGKPVKVEPDTLEKALAREMVLKVEVANLKAHLESVLASTSKPTLYEKKTRGKPGRTPEQQRIINERMAKARAGRKKKLTGVV